MINSLDQRKLDLQLLAREQYISQKEKEEIDYEKKRDAEALLKQAKDAYFNKINYSFSGNKVSLSCNYIL